MDVIKLFKRGDIVQCVDASGCLRLTEGRNYKVVEDQFELKWGLGTAVSVTDTSNDEVVTAGVDRFEHVLVVGHTA